MICPACTGRKIISVGDGETPCDECNATGKVKA